MARVISILGLAKTGVNAAASKAKGLPHPIQDRPAQDSYGQNQGGIEAFFFRHQYAGFPRGVTSLNFMQL
jgi:hypothetical protein